MKKYYKKVILSPEEISAISINLRTLINKTQSELASNKEDSAEIKKYIVELKKLQHKFQRLAVKIEKEVLTDINKINQSN